MFFNETGRVIPAHRWHELRLIVRQLRQMKKERLEYFPEPPVDYRAALNTPECPTWWHYLLKEAADNATIKVNHVPEWMTSGDPIVQRGSKTVVVSLTQTERRYQRWARKIVSILRGKNKW